MSDINIDNEILISLLEERPVLWDKTLDIYKDRNATRNAWREVCLRIHRDFDVLEEKERNDFGKEVMKRWKHLRDTFAKAEKKAKESKTSGSQANKKRKYVFNDELQFLKKVYEKTETTESFVIEEENKDETDGSWQQPPENAEEEVEVGLITGTKEKALSNTQPRRKHKKMDEVDLKILKALEKSEPEKPNSQMSFFHSLLPHTENFDSNEWLQFQMEVLRVISSIKNKKVAVPHYQGYITQSTSQFPQQSQSTPYHPQPQTFPQPPQQPFTTPMTLYSSQPPHLPPYDPPSFPSVSTQNALPPPLSQPRQNRPTFTTLASYPSQPPLLPHHDPSPSPSMKDKIKKTTAAEHYQHFAENVGEEDSERSPSVHSYTSSSTIDVTF